MPQQHVIKAVLKAVYSLPNYRQFKVLDLSCGEGEILENLAARGCAVEGTHYKANDYIVNRIPENICIHNNINLDKPLPFKDEAFDLVISTEVLEHLTTHFSIISEVGRILKPGGYLVLCTPNIHRLHSRLKFFLTGTHKLIRRRAGWDLKRDDLYAYHINPVDFPTLHTLLFQAKIRIKGLFFTLFKPRHSYLLLLYPLLRLATYLETSGNNKNPLIFKQGEKDLRKWLSHPALLASEQLLIIGEKNSRPD